MKIGIMQPYFVPYIGYWQLMNAVDKYVVYDDVNYIKKGWINRNRILVNGEPKYLTLSVEGASQNKRICEMAFSDDPKMYAKNLRMLECAYKRAPYYSEIFPLLEQIFLCRERGIVPYLMNSFRILCDYMRIDTELILSSSIKKDCAQKGQEKILAICGALGATEYYNAIGGQDLYSYERFRQCGIDLKFLKTDDVVYRQFENVFQANLSILDVMMFNSVEEIRGILERFTLL